MTWTVSASGTSSALTTGSENTVASSTTNATYVAKVDLTTLGLGDLIECRMYTGENSTGLIQAWKGTYQNAQINFVKLSPPIASNQSVSLTLKQINSSGSTASGNAGRSIPFTLLTI